MSAPSRCPPPTLSRDGQVVRAAQQVPAERRRHADTQQVGDALPQRLERVLEILRLVEHAQHAARGVVEVAEVRRRLRAIGVGRRERHHQRRDPRLADLAPERREVARPLPLGIGEVAPVGDHDQDAQRRRVGRQVGEIQPHRFDQVGAVAVDVRHVAEAADVGGGQARAALAHAPVDGRDRPRSARARAGRTPGYRRARRAGCARSRGRPGRPTPAASRSCCPRRPSSTSRTATGSPAARPTSARRWSAPGWSASANGRRR